MTPFGISKTTYALLPQLLLPWYRANARSLPWRQNTEPYRVWISEIMLQQTRVEAVLGYYHRFLEALPDIAALADIPEEKLLKLWEGLGYYSRARNLKKAAQVLMQRHGGRFPQTYDEIRALPGIGDYTAGAICSICLNMPTPAVDGNVLRITTRITGNRAPIDLPKTKADIAAHLAEVYPKNACGAFTQALMELGACICTPKSPKCPECPVKEICFSYKNNAADTLPVKLPKKEKRIEKRTVFILECDGKYALEKRAEKGLLSGLWQFPNQPGAFSPNYALKTATELGVEPAELLRQTEKLHIFTHIRWEMTGYYIRCSVQSNSFTWVSKEELQKKYALPTAFRIFFDN